MGQLKTGATYIYEHADGITYAREAGADPSTRKVIGMTLEKRSMLDQIKEDKLWGNIRRASETNPALQKALEQCIIIYHLSQKLDNKEVMFHPV